ncbi:GNAT family N-acetyltransferase [Haloarchaeobius sp. DFWS5]|uniref:GNAT family N-acetyltransferase n=1 Tax=Haloarchaeobius sp. DFWS5 TaxID=3446114 RepID=UPI003EB9BCB3
MSGDLHVRGFDHRDIDRIDAVRRAALRSAGVSFGDAEEDSTVEAIRANFLDGDGAFLVGTVDEEVVATAAFRPASPDLTDVFGSIDDTTAEVKWVHVAPDHHRRGFASTMLAELMSLARGRGYETFVLHTSEYQTAAHRFYENHGFELVAQTDVELDGESFEAWHYRKQL